MQIFDRQYIGNRCESTPSPDHLRVPFMEIVLEKNKILLFGICDATPSWLRFLIHSWIRILENWTGLVEQHIKKF